MKILEATKSHKIKAMLSLGGFEIIGCGCYEYWGRSVFNYEFIMLVIRDLNSMQFVRFTSILVGKTNPFDEILTLDKARAFFLATPEQLVDAVLVAAGKFEP